MKSVNLAILSSLLCVFSILTAESKASSQSRGVDIIWLNDGYQISVDNDPKWLWTFDEFSAPKAFTAVTPENYYPPAVVRVSRHYIDMPESKYVFKRFSYKLLQKVLSTQKLDTDFSIIDLKEKTYGPLSGYEYSYSSEAKNKTISDHKIFVGRASDGAVFTAAISVDENKLLHIEPAVNRMLKGIVVL